MVYDYSTNGDTRTFTSAAIVANNGTMAMWRASPSAQYMQPMAVSVVLQDSQAGTSLTGQGVRWIGLAFQISPLGRIYDKLSAGVKQ
jgi:hypothetical protein